MENYFLIERVIILSMCKLLIYQIRKLLIIFLDSKLVNIIYIILFL